MSGSLASLSKALVAAFSKSPELPPELPSIINSYIERHDASNEHDRLRLQEELLTIHHNHVDRSKAASFLHVLCLLKVDFLIEPSFVRQCWDLLLAPILHESEHLKSTLQDSLKICLDILIFSEEDKEFKVRHAAAETMKSCVLSSYFSAVTTERRQVAENIQILIIKYARKRTCQFFESIDPYLRNPSNRLHSLTLLSTFVRLQTPYIYQILDTPLFNSLLLCLEHDTSTTVVSLSMTILIMVIPHIPDKLGQMLPRLFGIFGRILCWDKLSAVQRRTAAFAKDEQSKEDEEEHKEDNEISGDRMGSWLRLDSSFDIANSTPPKCTQYFTFLYGMYPINFLEYLRTPAAYVRGGTGLSKENDSTDQSFDDELIRGRAEPLIRRHLVHPRLLTLTQESEVSDSSRWMESEPFDVVTLCISLDTTNSIIQSKTWQQSKTEVVYDDDVNELFLDSPISQTRNRTSHTNTGSGHLVERPSSPSSFVEDAGHVESLSLRMLDSFMSDVPETSAASRLASPAFLPTVIAQGGNSQDRTASRQSSMHRRAPPTSKDMVRVHEQLLMTGLPSFGESEEQVISKVSDSDRVATANYQREILLLRNELDFEKHLKQQYVQHIGRLQRGVITDAAVESERQNLYNTTRALKSQVRNLQTLLQNLRNESATSKVNRNQYEVSLNARIKSLREEKNSLQQSQDTLQNALIRAEENIANMRTTLGVSEGLALNLRQQLEVLQPEIQQAKDLQKNFDLLRHRLKDAEIQEVQLTMEKERVQVAESKTEEAEMALSALRGEFMEATKRHEEIRQQLQTAKSSELGNSQTQLPNEKVALLERMLTQKSSGQIEKIAQLRDDNRRLAETCRKLEEQVGDLKSQLDYKDLVSQYEHTRRPSLVSRAQTSSPAARLGKRPSISGPSGAPPSLTPSTAFADRAYTHDIQSPGETSSDGAIVHGARRTDIVSDPTEIQGKASKLANISSPAIPSSPSASTTKSSKSAGTTASPAGKKKKENKVLLGGRFVW